MAAKGLLLLWSKLVGKGDSDHDHHEDAAWCAAALIIKGARPVTDKVQALVLPPAGRPGGYLSGQECCRDNLAFCLRNEMYMSTWWEACGWTEHKGKTEQATNPTLPL